MASEMDKVKYDGNIMDKVEELLRRVSSLERRGVNLERLDELTDDLGEVRSGRFLAMSSGYEPTDPDASGVFMSAAGETFGEDTYNVGGVDNGALQFGLRSTDGVGVFSGGDATIGADGISINRMGYLIDHTATDGTTERTGSLGMWATPGSTEPQYGIAFNAPGGAELVTNGDAETGDLTGLTKTTETDCTLSVSTFGIDSTMEHALLPYAGSYLILYQAGGSGSPSGVLTFDAINVSSETNYICSAAYFFHTSGKLELKWYDSGSNLLRTDTVCSSSVSLPFNWSKAQMNLKSPINSASAVFVFTSSGGASNSYINALDSVSLQVITVASSLYFDSTGELCLNRSPVLPKHCYISGLAVESNATLTLITSGGTSFNYVAAAAANNGDTYTYQVPPLCAGTYTIYFCGRKTSGAGKVDWTLDGTSIVAGQDWYAGTTTDYVYTVTGVSVKSGAHTLLGTINGKNASSADYIMAMYSIVFVKTA